MSSLRFLSLRTVLDIAQDGSSQDLRTVKAPKRRIQKLQCSTNQEIGSTDRKSISA